MLEIEKNGFRFYLNFSNFDAGRAVKHNETCRENHDKSCREVEDWTTRQSFKTSELLPSFEFRAENDINYHDQIRSTIDPTITTPAPKHLLFSPLQLWRQVVLIIASHLDSGRPLTRILCLGGGPSSDTSPIIPYSTGYVQRTYRC